MAQLNQLRSNLGLGALTLDSGMSNFAYNWSQTMATSGFRHSGGPYGENIAYTSNNGLSPQGAASTMHGLWVNSPGHYANMTNPGHTSVGIGLFRNSSGWFATHVFR